MNAVFADTFYYLALLSDDAVHETAVEVSRTLHRRVVTTAWVLTEVADGIARTHHRALFSHLLKELRADAHVELVEADRQLFDRGVDCRNDRRCFSEDGKDWQDCLPELIDLCKVWNQLPAAIHTAIITLAEAARAHLSTDKKPNSG